MSNSKFGQFVGKCCDPNIVNSNNPDMIRELFENLFTSEEYKQALEKRLYIGYYDHPNYPLDCGVENICATMTECHIEDNGDIVGTFDLINTPVGKSVKSLIDLGVNFGISIRDIDNDSEIDPETFVFRGFDLVIFPDD